MNRLNAQIWLGAEYDVLDVDALGKSGVTSVLNMTRAPDHAFVRHVLDTQGVVSQYCQLDQDDGYPLSEDALRRGLEFLSGQLARNNVVLIHCAAGISRTAAMAIAFLMTVGFSWDEAELLVKNARPITLPHPELKRSVLQFFKRWPYDGSMQP